MTFEAPIQPVPARRGRVVAVVGAIVVVAGLLVWMPWSAPPGAAPPAGSLPAAAGTLFAGPTQAGVATASPAATTSGPSPTPYLPPVAAPLRGYMPFVNGPTLDLFRPRWSVVGVRDEANTPLEITQIPVVTSSGFVEGASADAICWVGAYGSSFVAVLPARTLRMIGIAAPAGEIASPVQLSRVDGTPVSAYELEVPPPADGSEARAAARLFVQANIERWPAGTYRFHLEAPDGTPRFGYACLLQPSLLDGTDVAQTGP